MDEKHIGDVIRAAPSSVELQKLKQEAHEFLNENEVQQKRPPLVNIVQARKIDDFDIRDWENLN